ncbi:MAG: sigma-70 family RNA polymerase sigma factor [Chloroflexota bacterium]
MSQTDQSYELEQINQACHEDTKAIGWLYERYSRRIYSYIYARLGDHAESEDATERVFLKMIENVGAYEPKGAGFAAWLFRIAHNQVVDLQRRNGRRTFVPLDEAWYVQASPGSDPCRQAELSDAREHLRMCISELSDLQACVITLRYAAELSNPEIADVMSRTTNAVNSLHYEALKHLGKLLAIKGYTR